MEEGKPLGSAKNTRVLSNIRRMEGSPVVHIVFQAMVFERLDRPLRALTK